jgi:predicted metalloprotease with PDZ domain
MNTPPIHYTVSPFDPAGHRVEVTLVVDKPDPKGQVLRLPAWIPGSYLVREFARNITVIQAHDATGPLKLEKVDKDTWRAPPSEGPLTVRAEIYAWDLSVRTAHLDQTHGFFNGTSLFLRVEGQDHVPHAVTLCTPEDPACADWQVATTLPRTSGEALAAGDFSAADYDALIDHPIEMGTFTHAVFMACGVPHEIAITGRHDCDMDRLSADLTAICEHHIRFFGEPAPVDRYLFMVMAVGNGYGGLEHRASTALLCKRDDLPRVGDTAATEDDDIVSEGYRRFLGLCSHEYFHTWNVKRIKPAAFTPFDLNHEAHTTLLWAFEGITSYFDDLGLLHSGCIDAESWCELMGRTITRVRGGDGRLTQSLADASFDAWTKFYRQDENAGNALVSYYTKGAMAAMCLDLLLRLRTDGAKSLDDVMGILWERYGQTGVGVPEDGVEAAAVEVAGGDLSEFFDLAIRGTADLPLAELLPQFGVELRMRPADGPDDKGGKPSKTDVETLRNRGDLGMRLAAGKGGVRVAAVAVGGGAHAGGISAGDVIVAMDGLRVTQSSLAERLGRCAPGETVTLHGFRRDELQVFTPTVRNSPDRVAELHLQENPDATAALRRKAWLGA